MIKIMVLLHRRPDLSVEEFRRYWHTRRCSSACAVCGVWC